MIYGYVRVSTKEQNSIPQATEIKNRYPDATIFTDRASGKSLDRPELLKLLRVVKKGDKIVIRELSRLGRTQGELMTLIEEYQAKGIEFEILNIGVDTSSVSGKMVLGILASVAQMERELLKERQAIGIEAAKEKNVYKGRPVNPNTMKKCKKAIEFLKANPNMTKEEAAKAAGIGVATLYRHIKVNCLVLS